MPRAIAANETFRDLAFPLAGLDLSSGFDRQPVRPLGDGQFARTTPAGLNVRAYEAKTNRARGGLRAGLARYVAQRVNGSALVQGLNQITGTGYTAPGGGVQTSQSGRVVTLVAVSGGTVKVADAGATSWTAVTDGAGALISSGIVFSAVNNQKLYFADGTNEKYYDPATNSVLAWTASAGTLPVDAGDNRPRLICTWRGRTVLSGLLKDPQNWFMSAVGDPTDFDYAPTSPSATQAVAGNVSTLGKVGDVITALVPYTDDILIFGTDHQIWAMTGDPMDGGQIDLVSDAIGFAWGMAWCKDPYGNIYFVSNRTGIYVLKPGSVPQRVSQPIEQLLQEANTGVNTISLIWDDRFQGLHVFITPTAGAAAATHFFWEARAGAWWTDRFANHDHSPLCAVTFDGNLPSDRVALIGSWDGFVRYLDQNATKDDGYDIASEVVLGPLVTRDLDDLLLKDLQAVLADDSGDVAFAVHVGETAEQALDADPVLEGTWGAGRNFTTHVRRSGAAIYVKLSASSPWAMEAIRGRLAATGKVRRRGVG